MSAGGIDGHGCRCVTEDTEGDLPMKKLATTVAAAGMLAAGLAAWPGAAAADTTAHGATSTRAPEYSPRSIAWGQCVSDSLREAGAQCGLLTVPLDYAKPQGTKIKIAVSRIMHKTSSANAQGVMLVNPGGPGGSGLELARLGAFVPSNGGDPTTGSASIPGASAPANPR